MKYMFLTICTAVLFFSHAGAMQKVSQEIPGKSQAVAKVAALLNAADDLLKKDIDQARVKEMRDWLIGIQELLNKASSEEVVKKIMGLPQVTEFGQKLEGLRIKKVGKQTQDAMSTSRISHAGAAAAVESAAPAHQVIDDQSEKTLDAKTPEEAQLAHEFDELDEAQIAKECQTTEAALKNVREAIQIVTQSGMRFKGDIEPYLGIAAAIEEDLKILKNPDNRGRRRAWVLLKKHTQQAIAILPTLESYRSRCIML